MRHVLPLSAILLHFESGQLSAGGIVALQLSRYPANLWLDFRGLGQEWQEFFTSEGKPKNCFEDRPPARLMAGDGWLAFVPLSRTHEFPDGAGPCP